MNNDYGLGPSGNCICPKCNYETAHLRGTPCQKRICPKCGAKMLRQGSYHHKMYLRKKEKQDLT